MKRRLCAAFLVFCLLFALSGCSLFSKTYTYSEDYTDTDAYILTSGTEVKDSDQLYDIILNMVSSGRASQDLSFLSYDGSVNEDLALACAEVRYSTPIGNYALEDLTFETNRIVSYYIATVDASYRVTRDQLSSIIHVTGNTRMQSQLQDLYDAGAGEHVISAERVLTSEDAIREALHSCFLASPLTYVHEPAVTISSYTAGETDGIYDIILTCDLNRGQISSYAGAIRRFIQRALPEDAGQTEVTGQSLLTAAESLKDMLGEVSFADSQSASLTDVMTGDPIDSKTAAALFRLMCQDLGLEALTVEGLDSSMESRAHTWNLVCLDGIWYHADLSSLGDESSRCFLVGDDTMWNYCTWDTEAYPSCREDYSFSAPAPASASAEADSSLARN